MPEKYLLRLTLAVMIASDTVKLRVDMSQDKSDVRTDIKHVIRQEYNVYNLRMNWMMTDTMIITTQMNSS